jgi:T-complex protein 1 subunit theta
LEHEASLIKGLDQYAFNKFAKAFEVFPRILAENAGLNANDILGKLTSANATTLSGLDIDVKI